MADNDCTTRGCIMSVQDSDKRNNWKYKPGFFLADRPRITDKDNEEDMLINQERAHVMKPSLTKDDINYLYSHPELQCIIDFYVFNILSKRPKNVSEFAGLLFSDPNIRQKIHDQNTQRSDQQATQFMGWLDTSMGMNDRSATNWKRFKRPQKSDRGKADETAEHDDGCLFGISASSTSSSSSSSINKAVARYQSKHGKTCHLLPISDSLQFSSDSSSDYRSSSNDTKPAKEDDEVSVENEQSTMDEGSVEGGFKFNKVVNKELLTSGEGNLRQSDSENSTDEEDRKKNSNRKPSKVIRDDDEDDRGDEVLNKIDKDTIGSHMAERLQVLQMLSVYTGEDKSKKKKKKRHIQAENGNGNEPSNMRREYSVLDNNAKEIDVQRHSDDQGLLDMEKKSWQW